jgi:hypothetical protein
MWQSSEGDWREYSEGRKSKVTRTVRRQPARRTAKRKHANPVLRLLSAFWDSGPTRYSRGFGPPPSRRHIPKLLPIGQ